MSLNNLKELETGLIRNLQGGRLDRVDDNTLCWAPYRHGSIAILKQNSWTVITRNSPIFFYSFDRDYMGNTLAHSTNYDVFAKYQDSTSFSLQLFPWSSDTVREEELQLVNGVWTLFNMRYLGTVRLRNNNGPCFTDSGLQRLVVNFNNKLQKYVSADTWGSTAWRVQSTSWVEFPNLSRPEFLCLDPSTSVFGSVALYRVSWSSGSTHYADIGLGLNSVSSIAGTAITQNGQNQQTGSMEAIGYGSPRFGWNWATVLVKLNVSVTYYWEYHAYNGEIGKVLLQVEV